MFWKFDHDHNPTKQLEQGFWKLVLFCSNSFLGGGFIVYMFTPTGGDDPISLIYFQMGWFNHRLVLKDVL